MQSSVVNACTHGLLSLLQFQEEDRDVLPSSSGTPLVRSCSSPPNLDSLDFATTEDGIDEMLQASVQRGKGLCINLSRHS